MPTVLVQTYSRNKLSPLYNDDGQGKVNVQLIASTTYAAGTVLGEVLATPGVYGAYVAGHSDGTQTAKVLLEYACVTDASGNITQQDGEWGAVYSSTSAYLPTRRQWNAADIVGLDAAGLTALGGVISEGIISAGTLLI
jgi:hypothetical protein